MKDNIIKIINQCENQIKKLLKLKFDDNFMSEIDVFDNYFNQLKQVINNENIHYYKTDIDNLNRLMEQFKIKLETRMNNIMTEIKNTEIKKRSIGYGYQQINEALKFDKRF